VRQAEGRKRPYSTSERCRCLLRVPMLDFEMFELEQSTEEAPQCGKDGGS